MSVFFVPEKQKIAGKDISAVGLLLFFYISIIVIMSHEIVGRLYGWVFDHD